ncbi:NTF2-like protein [Rhodocollybia butyracea]|uniref:NTF2-like protein n=1 Tax=Rhodocollybia butyracea TaxID=206335 RepID=A0A9P5Q6E0_9AGAR|nr:NTF2-like protein [Rhodocollybia butyracea]
MASTSSTGPAVTVLTRDDISIATRAADKFTQLYYTTYDSPSRLADLPNFYRPVSSLTWNGKPLQGPDGLRQLIENMPPTKHEMQSFDCHPIPGASPPSLLVTVSGTVVHGKPAPSLQRSKNIEGHARVFSQTFMLVPDSAAAPSQPGEPAKYYIGADALRFVG